MLVGENNESQTYKYREDHQLSVLSSLGLGKKINIYRLAIFIYFLSVILSISTADIAVKVGRLLLFGVLSIELIIRKKIKLSIFGFKPVIISAIFICFNFMLASNAYDSSIAYQHVFTIIYIFIVNTLIILHSQYDKYTVQTVVNSIIVSIVLKCFYVYIRYGPLVFLNARESDAGSANIIGMYAAVAAVLLFYKIQKNKNLSRNLPEYIILAVLFLSLVLSASRKSVLYFLIPVLFIYINKNKNKGKFVFRVLIAIAIVAALWVVITNVPIFYNLVGHRLLSFVNGLHNMNEADGSTFTRLKLIEFGVEMFMEKPLYGYGLGNYISICTEQYGINLYSHNNYIELLVSCGILGTAIYYLQYANFIKLFINTKNRTPIIIMLMGLIIAFLICDMAFVSYYEVIIQSILMVCCITFYQKNQIL